MAETFPALTDGHRGFVARQPMFFVATPAADARGDGIHVPDADSVARLDPGGAGNGTNPHLLAGGRITITFRAFDRPARILRRYVPGAPVRPGSDRPVRSIDGAATRLTSAAPA